MQAVDLDTKLRALRSQDIYQNAMMGGATPPQQPQFGMQDRSDFLVVAEILPGILPALADPFAPEAEIGRAYV